MRVGEQVFVTVNMAGRDVGQVMRAQPTGWNSNIYGCFGAFLAETASWAWCLVFCINDANANPANPCI
jgi:hypothetical protein